MYSLHHIALKTNDIEKTIQFYLDIFEGKMIKRFELKGKPACLLSLDHLILEIFEEDEKYPEGSFAHIALKCKQVDNLYEKAIRKGAQSHVAPKDITIPMKARIAFIKGTANEIIELFDERCV